MSVARQFERFLVRYQTDKTPLKLIGVNFEKDSVNYKKIDIGYAADKETKQLLATEKISQKMLLEFKMECKEVLIKATTLLLEKCPLKYSLVRNLACLDPREIAKNPEDSKAKFRRVVNKLDNAKRVNTKDCDDLLWQYNQFVSEVACASKSKYADYDPYSEARLDTFFCEEIGTVNEYSLLFDVVKICLCLSHGQATVERRFSVNANVIVENLQEESIVAQSIVHDRICEAGGVLEVPLSKELLTSVRCSHQKYVTALEAKRTQSDKVVKKRELRTEVTKRKKFCESAVSDLTVSADQLAQTAEKSRNFTKMLESNAVRERVREMQDEVQVLDEEIRSKKSKLQLLA